MIYDKTPTTISEQLVQLQNRGLLIPDLANAAYYLTNISYYRHRCCMKYLLNVIDAENRFASRLADLLTRYPNVDLNAPGFPTTWQTEPLWQH